MQLPLSTDEPNSLKITRRNLKQQLLTCAYEATRHDVVTLKCPKSIQKNYKSWKSEELSTWIQNCCAGPQHMQRNILTKTQPSKDATIEQNTNDRITTKKLRGTFRTNKQLRLHVCNLCPTETTLKKLCNTLLDRLWLQVRGRQTDPSKHMSQHPPAAAHTNPTHQNLPWNPSIMQHNSRTHPSAISINNL